MKKNNLTSLNKTSKERLEKKTRSRKPHAKTKQEDILKSILNTVNKNDQARKINTLILSIKKMLKEIKKTN